MPTDSVLAYSEQKVSPPEHGVLSFPDGDITLISSDEIVFRLDSIILKRASPFFADMLRLPQPGNGGNRTRPIRMEETGAILDDILRCIYPPAKPPRISSIDHALALLRTVRKFDMSSAQLSDAVTQYLGNIEPPIRAWAIALNEGHNEACKIAVRRFMVSNGDLRHQSHLDELSRIDVQSFFRLSQLRNDYVTEASSLIAECYRKCRCNSHTMYRNKGLPVADTGVLLPGDSVLKAFVRGTGCEGCLIRFVSEVEAIQQLRVSIEDMLERAVEMETGGSGVPVSTETKGFVLGEDAQSSFPVDESGGFVDWRLDKIIMIL